MAREGVPRGQSPPPSTTSGKAGGGAREGVPSGQQHRRVMVMRIAGVLDRDPKYSALSNAKTLQLPEVRALTVHKRMLAQGKKLFLQAKAEKASAISDIRSVRMGPRRVGIV